MSSWRGGGCGEELSDAVRFERATAVYPDRTAITDGPRSFTYAEVAAQVIRLARVAYLATSIGRAPL